MAESHPEDQSTVRLGGMETSTGSLPAWRARYEDLGELARGGLASVRVVYDRLMLRRVAMKVHDQERDPSGLAHFLEEARITGQLDHPNVVPVHDVHHDELGLPSRFTMKLVDSETLADVLERRGGRAFVGEELEFSIGVFLKICDAVSFAHSRGVIHCDLKPSNVLVGSHGQVYVTDWGVALRRERPGSQAAAPAPATGQSMLSGTPAFMAPEQTSGRREQIDERTDVYGLGGVLFALMTTLPPRDGGSSPGDLELAKRGIVRRPEDVAQGRALPPGLCRIALRALEADPQRRYPSVDALKREVEQFMRGGGWFETVQRPKGALVVDEGDAPDAAYILLEGECELLHEVAGEQRPIGKLGPGDVFGEIAIFGSSARIASVVALTDVSLVRVTREALQRELERSGWLKTFVEALAHRFIEVDRQLRVVEAQAEATTI